MKKQLLTSILLLISLIIVVPRAVEAQTEGRMLINVPFDFVVAGKRLPAGRYSVSRFDPNKPEVLMIKNVANGMMRVFFTHRVTSDHQTGRASKLVFRQRGPAYHLFQVCGSDANERNQLLPIDENEERNQGSNKAAVVTLGARNKRP